MRRIVMLVAVAATLVAMVLLNAAVVVAQTGGGLPGLEEYCAARGGEVATGTGQGQPTCTFTQTTSGIPAQHGFTLTRSQEFTLSLTEFNNNQDPTPQGNPTIVSCQNPGGKDVPLKNPNCTPAS